jgi:hypothetical protein
MKFSFILIYFVSITRVFCVLSDLLGKCLSNSNCKSTEYCDRELLSPLGECKQGLENGKACLKNSICASKRCSLFRCVERNKFKDGQCKMHQDCPNDQYCNDDTCLDRKCRGFCKLDAECMSNQCHLFRCVRDVC